MTQPPCILKGKQLSTPELLYWSNRTTVSKFEILVVVLFGPSRDYGVKAFSAWASRGTILILSNHSELENILHEQFSVDLLPCQVAKRRLNQIIRLKIWNVLHCSRIFFLTGYKWRQKDGFTHRLLFEGWVCSWQVLKPIFKSTVEMGKNWEEGERESCWEGRAIFSCKMTL